MVQIQRKGIVVLTIAVATVAFAATAAGRAVTPNDAYSVSDLTERTLDVLLKARGIDAPAKRVSRETGLGPFHVYQLQVACIERLHRFQKGADLSPAPLVTSTPMKYTPADVQKLGKLLLAELRAVASATGVSGLPENAKTFTDKTPTDVFALLVGVFSQLRALNEESSITPNEVYGEAVRAVGDARSILSQIDPASRYRIDVPTSKEGLSPRDVFAKCLEVRAAINRIRGTLGLGNTPVMRLTDVTDLSPEDVFLQMQILIAESNLVKMGTGTVSSTALAVPVHGKTASDVHQQVALLQYLLEQINPLRELVATAGR